MKNILIVGANSFIAKNAIQRLQHIGYNCIQTTRSSKNKSLQLNIENEKDIEQFALLNNNTFVDGILFFQGINPSKNAKEMTAEHFIKMLNVNLIGPTLLLKHFHQNINKNAMLLFISSIAAQRGSYDPSYASAKSAIKGLTESLANEFPAFRFNTISLGLVENSPVYNNMTADFRLKHAERMNHKFIQADDISAAIVELIENTSINRTTVNMNGDLKN